MKRLIGIAIVFALSIALIAPASIAETTMDAHVEGTVMNVRWNGVGNGPCTLSIYQDGWPIGCYSVSGPAADVKIPLNNPTGRLSVRLKTSSGCLTTDVTGGDGMPQAPAPTGSPDATPKPTQTQKPDGTPIPTPVPGTTLKPTGDAAVADNAGLAAQVVAQVNEERTKAGLSVLRVDAELNRAARVRAEEIIQKFSHTRPDGRAWSTVSSLAYGENIAMGQRTADKVMAAWMSSEGHRANILRPSYGSIGVCALVRDGVVYWVQLFGK